MNRIYGAILTGTAIAVLGASLACGSKREYPIIPTDPTHITAPAPTLIPTLVIPTVTPASSEPTQSLDNMVTAEPEPTAIPGTADPSPLPESTPYNKNTNINPQQTPEITSDNNPIVPQQTLEAKVEATATPEPVNTPAPYPTAVPAPTAAPVPTPRPTYNPPESTPEPESSPTPRLENRVTATTVPTAAPTLEAEVGVVTPVPNTPAPYPTAAPVPTLAPEIKTFELACDSCTDEQYKSFHDNALEDYRTVLGVYGINENDARVEILIGNGENYSIGFYFRGMEGGNAWVGFDSFTTNRQTLRHEMSHAVNHTLYPTYHSWFDEGLAMYASGEVANNISFANRHEGNFFYSTVNREENLEQYWSEAGGFVAGHIIGVHFFGLMEMDYGLTPKNNRTALSLLNQKHIETGKDLTKFDIKNAYEQVLEISLDPLFDILKTGVMSLYKGQYRFGDRIKSEF